MHYADSKKPDLKSYLLYDSIHMTFWKKQNYREKKKRSLVDRGWWMERLPSYKHKGIC